MKVMQKNVVVKAKSRIVVELEKRVDYIGTEKGFPLQTNEEILQPSTLTRMHPG